MWHNVDYEAMLYPSYTTFGPRAYHCPVDLFVLVAEHLQAS